MCTSVTPISGKHASTLQQLHIPYPRSDLKTAGHHIAALTPMPQPLDFPTKWISKGGDAGKGGKHDKGGGRVSDKRFNFKRGIERKGRSAQAAERKPSIRSSTGC